MQQPSTLRQILRQDWPALGLVILAAVFGSLWLGLWLVPAQDASEAALRFGLRVVLTLAALGFGLAATLRLLRLRRILQHGPRTLGRILRIDKNVEDIESVLIEYQFEGKAYTVRNVTEADAGRFKTGQNVGLAVDPQAPNRAYLIELYEPADLDPRT